MAGLPNAEQAVLEIQKIEDYCLSPTHPRGRNKARVFRRTLDIGPNEAVWLRQTLVAGAQVGPATRLETDDFGTRWRVDVPVERHKKSCVVRTLWIIRTGETAPRFVTCWVL